MLVWDLAAHPNFLWTGCPDPVVFRAYGPVKAFWLRAAKPNHPNPRTQKAYGCSYLWILLFLAPRRALRLLAGAEVPIPFLT